MVKVKLIKIDKADLLYANCFVVTDSKKQCVVVDPTAIDNTIVDYIEDNGLTLKGILLTHGHCDHVRGVDVLYKKYKVPVFIGGYDIYKLRDSHINCSEFLGECCYVLSPAVTISDNDVLNDLIDEEIIVIDTPYHTSGSVCYYFKNSNILFSGDFILPHGVGRCDLPSSIPEELPISMAKIKALPKTCKIYGGHGGSSTLEIELRLNPFVK